MSLLNTNGEMFISIDNKKNIEKNWILLSFWEACNDNGRKPVAASNSGFINFNKHGSVSDNIHILCRQQHSNPRVLWRNVHLSCNQNMLNI